MRKFSEFNRNVVTLLGGGMISQLIPLLVIPILTRLYTPEQFGFLALFMSICITLGSVINFRYEMAILLPDDDNDAMVVFVISLILATLNSMILFLFIAFFEKEILKITGLVEFSHFLKYIPLVVWLIGLHNSANCLNTRYKRFKLIAVSNIGKSSSLSVSQVICGLVNFNKYGLVIGYILSHLILVWVSFRRTKFCDIKRVNVESIIPLLKRYKQFPKFSVAAILANNLSIYMMNFVINHFYGTALLGLYSFSQRILGLPSLVIGNSIGQVYFQKASEERRLVGHALHSFDSTLRKLSIISFCLFFPLYFCVEYIFYIVFGPEWKIAGEYCKLLLPYFAIRFVAVSLSNTNTVFEKQKISLGWQIGLLVLSILISFFSYFYGLEIDSFLLIVSFVLSLYYFLLLMILRKVAMNGK